MDIKAEEISALIKKRIKHYEEKIESDDTGVVVTVGDGIALIQGLDKAMASELVVFEDDTYDRPEEKAIDNAMKNDINNIVDSLKPNEARVIRMRYGLNGYKPMSLKEVGEICDLTKERIRQIEKNAIVRLQHPTRSRKLEAYVA